MSQETGPGGPQEDPRVRLAAERTLLAWIRTGLAMMGFGFVVARFGLFLRELAGVGGMYLIKHTGWSLAMGTTLVLMGVAATLLAAVQHVRFLVRLSRGATYQPPRWSFGVVVAAVLSALGAAMAIYLIVLSA